MRRLPFRVIDGSSPVEDPVSALSWMAAYARDPDRVPRPSDGAIRVLGSVIAKLEDHVASGVRTRDAVWLFETELGLCAAGQGKPSRLERYYKEHRALDVSFQ